ncbi:MAG: glycosyltransferase [Dermatophilaceae bacterium]
MSDKLGTAMPFGVVMVSYLSRHHIAELLNQWQPQGPVVVVDNSGGRDSVRELEQFFPTLQVLDGAGEGFARAANQGAAALDAEYLVFVNPDSRPSTADLRSLVDGLAADSDALSHAGTMTDAEGDVEIGVGGWEPNFVRAAVYAGGLHKVMPTQGLYAKPPRGVFQPVDWTTGACMAVRRSDFLRLGGFDEGFFVYCEDLSLGRRAREAGLRQVLRHDVVVRHGAGSSGAPSLEMLRLRGASIANYAERYHPRSAVGIRTALALGYSLRSVQRRLRGDRAHAEQFRAYVRGVVTKRASVGGQEVARARFLETSTPAAAGQGRHG